MLKRSEDEGGEAAVKKIKIYYTEIWWPCAPVDEQTIMLFLKYETTVIIININNLQKNYIYKYCVKKTIYICSRFDIPDLIFK